MRVVPLACVAIAFGSKAAHAMCGCALMPIPAHPVDKGAVVDAKPELIADSARVALVRDGEQTVMTMATEMRGADLSKFALIVPMPTAPTSDAVSVGDGAIFHDLEVATRAHFEDVVDPPPCPRANFGGAFSGVSDDARVSALSARSASAGPPRPSDYGVTIENHFDVGEYSIAILAAKDKSGLIEWLRLFKYDVPKPAADVIDSYLKQGMHFFVARVSLQEAKEKQLLRPLVVRYRSPKFVLPIRLGMVNADGAQELLVFALSKRGRIEPANYRVVKAASDVEIPGVFDDEKLDLVREMFLHAEEREHESVVFLEYAGVARQRDNPGAPALSLAKFGAPWSTIDAKSGDVDEPTIVTRLHFRYANATFPEDLVLQETDDKSAFAPAFVVHREAEGPYDCPAGQAYVAELRARRAKQAADLAAVTGRSEALVTSHFPQNLVDVWTPPPPPPPPPNVDSAPAATPTRAPSCGSCGHGAAPVVGLALLWRRRRC